MGLVNAAVVRAAGLAMGTPSPNLFATLGRHRATFRAWMRFAGRLMPRGRLPRRDTELVILRVAHLRRATYEHEHHARMGRRFGIDDAVLARVRIGPGDPLWTARERALLEAVDGIVRDGDVSDLTWTALRAHLEDRDAIELVLLASHYDMLATVIGTLRIAPDHPRPPARLLRRGRSADRVRGGGRGTRGA